MGLPDANRLQEPSTASTHCWLCASYSPTTSNVVDEMLLPEAMGQCCWAHASSDAGASISSTTGSCTLTDSGVSNDPSSNSPSNSNRSASEAFFATGWPGSPALNVLRSLLRMRAPKLSWLNSSSALAGSTLPKVRSAMSTPRSRSRTKAFTLRLSLICSMLSRSASPFLPLISSACSITPSKPPYWLIHLAAKPSPTPGTPGMLSAVSPRNAARSGYWRGVPAGSWP